MRWRLSGVSTAGLHGVPSIRTIAAVFSDSIKLRDSVYHDFIHHCRAARFHLDTAAILGVKIGSESLAVIGILSTILVVLLGVGMKMIATLAHITRTNDKIYEKLEEESEEHIRLTERSITQQQVDAEILNLLRQTLEMLKEIGREITELRRNHGN